MGLLDFMIAGFGLYQIHKDDKHHTEYLRNTCKMWKDNGYLVCHDGPFAYDTWTMKRLVLDPKTGDYLDYRTRKVVYTKYQLDHCWAEEEKKRKAAERQAEMERRVEENTRRLMEDIRRRAAEETERKKAERKKPKPPTQTEIWMQEAQERLDKLKEPEEEIIKRLIKMGYLYPKEERDKRIAEIEAEKEEQKRKGIYDWKHDSSRHPIKKDFY